MVVYNFHIERPWGVFRPFKANSPLFVDANAVLAFAITLQPFESVSRGVQSHQSVRRMQPVEPQHGLPLKPLKCLDPFSLKKAACPLVAEIYDHLTP